MDLANELAEVLREESSKHGVPGAVAGIVLDDQRVVAASGVTSIDDPQPVDGATLFQVGSITKTFTSAAIMVLVREGLISLDDPAAKHVPELRARTGLDLDSITLEQLLSHQAGFDGDHLLVERTGELASLQTARRLFAPGTAFSYNNAAFSIAGAIIERASGEPFERFVRARLLKPLGMRSACFTADNAILHRVAMSHVRLGDETRVIRRVGWQPGWELQAADRPAGGLIASVDHLLEWCRFQWSGTACDGTELLDEDDRRRMHTPVVNANAEYDIALDWFNRRANAPQTIDHGGSTAGYLSELVVAPAERLGVVCLTNATNGAAVTQAVRRWALERVGGIREVDPEPSVGEARDTARYAGTYLSSFAQLTVIPGPSTGTIVITSAERSDTDGWKPPCEPPITFGFFADDHAVSLDCAAPVRVVRFGNDWMLWGVRRAPKIA